MQHKMLSTSDGKAVHVYDNVFSFEEMDRFLDFVENSKFVLGGKTSNHVHQNRSFLHSNFTEEDLKAFGFVEKLQQKECWQKIKPFTKISPWVLLTTHLTKYFTHIDSFGSGFKDGTTVLYYCNMRWDSEWGGETIFCDNFGSAEIAVECKPNRVVIFDSSIPHRVAQLSLDADQYRFTFSLHCLS